MSSVMNKVGIFALCSLITVFWRKLSCILFFMNALWQLEIMESRLGAQVCWQREGEIFRNAMNQADQFIVSHPYDIKDFFEGG